MNKKAFDAERQPTRIVDGFAFLCEIALLVALAFIGNRLGHTLPARILLAVAFPAVGVIIWTVWMAPTARSRLDDPWRFIAEVALFGATAWLAAFANLTAWGIALAIVGIGTFGLTRINVVSG